jgi:uncharacterized protein with GYD domain
MRDHKRAAVTTSEAVGGKLIGGWYCSGDYDRVISADVPNNESMVAIGGKADIEQRWPNRRE